MIWDSWGGYSQKCISIWYISCWSVIHGTGGITPRLGTLGVNNTPSQRTLQGLGVVRSRVAGRLYGSIPCDVGYTILKHIQRLCASRCSGLQLGAMLGGQVQFLRNVFQYDTELMGGGNVSLNRWPNNWDRGEKRDCWLTQILVQQWR